MKKMDLKAAPSLRLHALALLCLLALPCVLRGALGGDVVVAQPAP
jgi:hypothetical protein